MARLELVSGTSDDPIVSEVFARTVAKAGAVPNLYRALANSPEILQAWVSFTWPLRDAPVIPRGLRELAILRVAQLADARYEWAHHRPMALNHGVRPEQIEALADWRGSDKFDDDERALLRYVDAVAAQDVDADTFSELVARFSPAAVIELTVTASFYHGVIPRVIQALQIELEPEYDNAESDPSKATTNEGRRSS